MTIIFFLLCLGLITSMEILTHTICNFHSFFEVASELQLARDKWVVILTNNMDLKERPTILNNLLSIFANN